MVWNDHCYMSQLGLWKTVVPYRRIVQWKKEEYVTGVAQVSVHSLWPELSLLCKVRNRQRQAWLGAKEQYKECVRPHILRAQSSIRLTSLQSQLQVQWSPGPLSLWLANHKFGGSHNHFRFNNSLKRLRTHWKCYTSGRFYYSKGIQIRTGQEAHTESSRCKASIIHRTWLPPSTEVWQYWVFPTRDVHSIVGVQGFTESSLWRHAWIIHYKDMSITW